MSETTKNIVDGFRVLRRFCNNVGELLTNANEMMEQAGWKRIWKRTPAIYIRDSLEEVEYWLPESFFCYYEHDNSPHLLPFIAVHVDDYLAADDYDADRVKEALISAGWAEYAGSTNAKEQWDEDYRVHSCYLWMKDRRDNGTLHSGDAAEIWEDDETPAGTIMISTFGYPLGEITSSDALKEKVVQPLLDEIQKHIQT